MSDKVPSSKTKNLLSSERVKTVVVLVAMYFAFFPPVKNDFELHTHTHTHTRLMALFQDYPGKPVPER